MPSKKHLPRFSIKFGIRSVIMKLLVISTHFYEGHSRWSSDQFNSDSFHGYLFDRTAAPETDPRTSRRISRGCVDGFSLFAAYLKTPKHLRPTIMESLDLKLTSGSDCRTALFSAFQGLDPTDICFLFSKCKVLLWNVHGMSESN